MHPWQDWAECWAHYPHGVDSLDTALGLGPRDNGVNAPVELLTVQDLYDPQAPDAQGVSLLMNSWMQMTTVLNAPARSMGQHDFYPVVMKRTVLRKLHFIQMVVNSTREASGPRTPIDIIGPCGAGRRCSIARQASGYSGLMRAP